MKLSVLFAIFFLITSSKSHEEFRIKRFKCKSFDQQVFTVQNCSVRDTERKIYYSIVFKLNKYLPKPFYLQIVLAKRTASNYFQDYFRTDLIEVCGVMEEMKINPFFKTILDALGSVPDLIHPCPYKAGILNASNIIVEKSKIFHFPLLGVYKSEYNFYNKKKAPLAFIRIDQERKADNVKDTKRFQF